jgi:hypothetical protein
MCVSYCVLTATAESVKGVFQAILTDKLHFKQKIQNGIHHETLCDAHVMPCKELITVN